MKDEKARKNEALFSLPPSAFILPLVARYADRNAARKTMVPPITQFAATAIVPPEVAQSASIKPVPPLVAMRHQVG